MRNNYTFKKGLSPLMWLSLLFFVPLLVQGQMHHKEAWKQVTDDAQWSPRAGLQIVHLNNNLYVLGGRTPIQSDIPGDSEIWGDVWKSNLKGKKWKRILETNDQDHWPARAYFSAFSKGKYMYVVGGQNFNPFGPSTFFNDVWRSKDGVKWKKMTKDNDDNIWVGRAGLSCFVFNNEIYVLGGSKNDDSAVVGGPPKRIYFKDIWKSKDGKHWELVTDDPGWEPRAGMRTVVKGKFIYMMGGERGFTPEEKGEDPPYYNDVWQSSDGKNWTKMIDHAPWSARPGFEVLLYNKHFVLFGGFNLDPEFNVDPDYTKGEQYSAKPNNPMDIWMSRDGKKWIQLPGSPWNAKEPMDVKYDFHAIVVPESKRNRSKSIMTVGGDRETFDFRDPFNYLNVDNDVWRFYPNTSIRHHVHDKVHEVVKLFKRAYPNPFVHDCTFEYHLPEDGHLAIHIYDVAGNLIQTLCDKHHVKGEYKFVWNGRDISGKTARKGMYFVKMTYQNKTDANIVIKK
ncbi:Kelch repeat-containing protein [Carboxylicivirga marina]|uniref:T9SS type A sorting domain-containing protein n=1 Tax=Carboxylicivirga marina TaxID=2800988 RepID=A0ABS1HMK5_9BACT|nr:FlgD immunoglobulin-like domain containing protein [Carboxylicivirga marina]MBK3518866.1 T9SS type A sorting domain-containing protein [Carboxylicivirga marina]